MQYKQFLKPGISLLLLAIPLIMQDLFVIHLGIRAATYAIVVMGLTLFAGYTGQISMGHAAFFGLAAYASGLMVKLGVAYPLAILISTVSVAGLGCLIGILVLRTSGHYLALASIAIAIIIQVLIKNSEFTGGPSGLTGIPGPSLFGMHLQSDAQYYLYVVICMLLGYVILNRVIRSRTGDALQAIANNELAAQSLGINVFKYKVMSFTISVLFAAFAGTLFGHYDGFIDPDKLGIQISILFLIMAYVGGIGNLFGSIVGAFTLTIIEEYSQDFGQYNIMVYGILLVIIILFLPKGLVDIPNKIRALRRN